MNSNNLGRRLRAVRQARGLTQQAVADILGLPRTAVTQIEAGKRSVSTLELSRLARIYYRPVAYFLEETPEGVDAGEEMLVALHRVEPGLGNDRKVREQTNRCINLCLEGVALRSMLGLTPRSWPPNYEINVPGNAGEAVSQGQWVAEQERHRLGIGKNPVQDISKLIGTQGIWVSKTVLPNRMSGLFLRHPSIGFVILVNASHPLVRRRFSYAHEYAHALLDRGVNVSVSVTDNSSELAEKRANAFAAMFLMPKNGVLEVLQSFDKGLPSRREQVFYDAASGKSAEAEFRSPPRSQKITYKDVALVARCFRVSYAAALYHLNTISVVSRKDVNELKSREELAKKYINMFGPVENSGRPEYPDWGLRDEIAHLAIEAYRREIISRGRLLELGVSLEIQGETLLDLAEGACDN